MFSVFGERSLDPINTTLTPSEISAWKHLQKTVRCYARLFQPIKNNEETSYMTRILKKIWPKSDCTEEQVAFAISVYEYFLNPDNDSILINEQAIRDSLLENKVHVSNSIFSKDLKISKIF